MRRYLSIILLSISLICLASLTYLAKKYTNYPPNIAQIRLVSESPDKIRDVPNDRGGKRFDNQDKNVFDILE